MLFTGLSTLWKLSQAEMPPIKQKLMQTLYSHCCTATLGAQKKLQQFFCFGAHVVQVAENQGTKML